MSLAPTRSQPVRCHPGSLTRWCYSYPDDSPLKQFVLASGYVDFNYIKEKTNQPAGPEVEQGDGTKVEL